MTPDDIDRQNELDRIAAVNLEPRFDVCHLAGLQPIAPTQQHAVRVDLDRHQQKPFRLMLSASSAISSPLSMGNSWATGCTPAI
jgi:hypothetical protein